MTRRSVGWSPGGVSLATAAHDKTVRVWNPKTGVRVTVCTGHSSRVYAVAWRRDDHRPRLASASHDGTVRIFDPRVGACTVKCVGHKGAVYSVAWSSKGARSWLASGGQDMTVRVWDATVGRCIAVHTGHAGPLVSVAWSAEAKQLLSASDDSTLKLWSVAEPQRYPRAPKEEKAGRKRRHAALTEENLAMIAAHT